MTSPSGLRVEEVTAASELGPFQAEWEGLAERAPHAELFETHLWISAWLDSFWKDGPLAFLFVRSGEELVGLAPLLDDREGSLGCPHSLVTPVNPHARRCSLLAAGDPGPVVAAVLAHLERTRRGSRMRLRCCDASSPVVAALERRRPLSLMRQKDASPIIRLEGDWEEYLASRPRHLRHELARKRKRLETEWDAKWVSVADAAGAERAMTDVLRIERNSWKDREGTSLVSEPGASAFYTRIARNCAARGMAAPGVAVPGRRAGGAPPGSGLPRHLLRPQDLLRRGLPRLVAGGRPVPVRHPQGLRGRPGDLRLPGGRLPLEDRTGQRPAGPRRCLRLRRSALHCRWDRARVARIKPFLEERAPALVALRRRVVDGPAKAPEAGD